MIKINNFRGELTDNSAKKEALQRTDNIPWHHVVSEALDESCIPQYPYASFEDPAACDEGPEQLKRLCRLWGGSPLQTALSKASPGIRLLLMPLGESIQLK